jgi:uncharacterized protein YjdB
MRTLLSRSTIVSLIGLLAACSSSPTESPVTTDPPVVTVTPSVAALERGGSLRLTAEMRRPDGTYSTPADLHWGSSNPSIATVASGGMVQGVKAGRVKIVAEWQGTLGTANVTVVEPGGMHCLQVPLGGTSAHPHGTKCA